MHQRETEVIQINPSHPEDAIIQRAAKLLQAGELVVFPTETVYGLGADALQTPAVCRIFAAKERPFSDPLIVHIADLSSLEMLVASLAPAAKQLAHTFWPGPLTMVLPASRQVPKLVTAGMSTVAVRMPHHPVALALIRATGSPIAAPSANLFMHVSPTTAQHALADLHGRVPLIIDGGPCPVGVESTVLDLCSDVPTLLRPGGVSLEALRAVLPTAQHPRQHAAPQAEDEAQDAQRAPGQMRVHYAPAVPAYLFEGPPEQMRAAMLAELQRRQALGEHVGILIADEDLPTFQGSEAAIYVLGSVTAPAQVAAHLFAGLRTLEEDGVQAILCRNFEEYGLGLAIRDRLLKATGGNICR